MKVKDESEKVGLKFNIHKPKIMASSPISAVQFSDPVVSAPCDPMDCSRPGLPVHHQLLELTQTHVHWVGDAIQLSHPLSSPSPPAFNLSQPSGSFPVSRLFVSSGQRIGASASTPVLAKNIQGWFPLGLTGLISLQPKGLNSLLQHHSSKASFFGAQPSLWSSSHIHTWLLGKP